jgi:hypothetical protein
MSRAGAVSWGVCYIERSEEILAGNLTGGTLRILPGGANEVWSCGPGCAGQGADRKSSCEDHLRSLNATDP